MNLKTPAAVFAVLTCASGAALADETWYSPTGGRIVYETDIGDTAVLSFDGTRSGRRAHLYVPGLGGNVDNRGVFYGYWIEPTQAGECPTVMDGPDGLRSGTWGQAVVSFDSTGFPSGWTAFMGSCFNTPYEMLRADP